MPSSIAASSAVRLPLVFCSRMSSMSIAWRASSRRISVLPSIGSGTLPKATIACEANVATSSEKLGGGSFCDAVDLSDESGMDYSGRYQPNVELHEWPHYKRAHTPVPHRRVCSLMWHCKGSTMKFLGFILGILSLGLLGGNLSAADKPNIVLIFADDLGINDLSCYGRKDQPTRNLDRMAAEGMRFR